MDEGGPVSAVEMKATKQNAAALELELTWLAQVIDVAIRTHLNPGVDAGDVPTPSLAELPDSVYRDFIDAHGMSFDERLVMILAMAPHFRPQVLDPFSMSNKTLNSRFSEFGGIMRDGHAGFWPTLQTAAFLLSGDRLERRFELQRLFDPSHFFAVENVFPLAGRDSAHSRFSIPLDLNPKFLNLFSIGSAHQPSVSPNFLAKPLTTQKEWTDLVLPPRTQMALEDMMAWFQHHDKVLREQRLEGLIDRGLHGLFYGPPGTGKTMAAALIGKAIGVPVYRIDLSLVSSTWGGETERNLGSLFDQAESNHWILFFDEADALLSKRAETASSNDRHANQELGYLLQRIEGFRGALVLASSLKVNLDSAIVRRLQFTIPFSQPREEERRQIWSRLFAPPTRLAPDVNLEALAAEYEINGSSIVNVLRYASVMAMRRQDQELRLTDLREGVRRELQKTGRVA